MGFLNKKPVIKQEGFQPLELNEGNVQAIFNRCLAKEGENFYNVQVVGPDRKSTRLNSSHD